MPKGFKAQCIEPYGNIYRVAYQSLSSIKLGDANKKSLISLCSFNRSRLIWDFWFAHAFPAEFGFGN